MTTNTEMPDAPAKVPRVALCLTCSNEWMARDGSQKKPSRCPECLSRKVKWRDECKPEEEKLTEIKEEPVEIPDTAEAELPEEPQEKEPQSRKIHVLPAPPVQKMKAEPVTLAEIQEDMKGRINGLPLVFVFGGLVLVGIISMSFRRRKARVLQAQRERQRMEEEQRRANEAPLDLLRYRVTGSPF